MDDQIETNIDGLIKKIEIKNFLCHDNLAIDFTAGNIHWVTGLNGSGKSAIISALVVGLGGKAAATHRGKNIQSFIKNGRDFASVEITIKNDTENAYNHHIYGDEIKINRRITTSGGSTYTVKAASGERISNSFSEVTNIMLALEIQVDNPISVLNQEEAKTFSTMDSKKMYSLFRRATNLDHSQNNYNKGLENCQRAKIIKNDKEKTCATLKKEYEKWKTKQDQLLLRDKKEKELTSINNEILWSEIRELKCEMKHMKEKIETKKGEIIQQTSIFEDSENNNTFIKTLKEKQIECDRAIMALKEEQKNQQEKIRREKEKCHRAQIEANSKRSRLEKMEKNIKDFENAIRDIDVNLKCCEVRSGGSAARRAEAERAEQSALAARDGAAKRLAAAEGALHEALRREADADAAAEAQLNDVHNLSRRLGEAASRLQRARQAEPLAQWGEHVAELCRRVRLAVQRREFERPPVGPVGHYLHLRDQKWANALDHIIGNSKTTFCVHSAADSRKLVKIMNEVFDGRAKPVVTCSPFLAQPHDVSRHRVRARPSALDALDVDNPVVTNFLIDNLSLETVLLVPDDESAMRLADTVENVPVNCSKIVTEDCTEFYPAPNYRSYGRDPQRPHDHYLQLRTDDVERRLREEKERAEAALQAQRRAADEAQRAAEQARRDVRAARKRFEVQRDALHDCSAALDAARRALGERRRAPQHDALEEELQKTKEEYHNLKIEIDNSKINENEYEQNIKRHESKIKELEAEINENIKSKRSLQREMDNKQMKEKERSNLKLLLKQNKDIVNKMEQEMLQKEEEISKKVAEAPSPPFENPRARGELQQRARELGAQLRALRALAHDEEDVRAGAARAYRRYRQLRDLLHEFGNLIEEIHTAVENRLTLCSYIENQITRKVQHNFAHYLAEHGYYGELLVSHSSGTLELSVTGRDGTRDVRKAKALSGGERSYCTVALLLAFWECVELPFYFLDEFDVCLLLIKIHLTIKPGQKEPANSGGPIDELRAETPRAPAGDGVAEHAARHAQPSDTAPGGRVIDKETWWWNDEMRAIKAVHAKKTDFKEWQQTNSPEDKEEYKTAKHASKRAVVRACSESLLPLC
ncbi:unnamed protein product [Euphydryas editha]|uniref:Structural maintenance of chromosomes protein 6 n=1 Tax=Euphydryas editha TaxID=104508 RepID=A0AAU9U8K5_EUPED|nr:unnamed protein product [Euphydryas editha]